MDGTRTVAPLLSRAASELLATQKKAQDMRVSARSSSLRTCCNHPTGPRMMMIGTRLRSTTCMSMAKKTGHWLMRFWRRWTGEKGEAKALVQCQSRGQEHYEEAARQRHCTVTTTATTESRAVATGNGTLDRRHSVAPQVSEQLSRSRQSSDQVESPPTRTSQRC